MRSIIVVTIAIVIFTPLSVRATRIDPKFSLDSASPAIDGNITPDDVLRRGPIVHTHGRNLGLQDDFFAGVFDDLDGLTYGKDPIRNPIFFSVDRVAVGILGSDVHAQALPGVASAAGDVYRALPPFGSNRLFIQERTLGLTPGFFGDDLNGLELDTEPPHTYFSIDFLSASNGFGALALANDIFIDRFPAVFASGEENIGLDPMDDIDALVLFDVIDPGVLNPGIDMALFSLSTFSPSTFTGSADRDYLAGEKGCLSPGDILFTDFLTERPSLCTGQSQKFRLWASAGGIGLLPDDNVDALDTVPASHPSQVYLIGGGGLLLALHQEVRRRRRSRCRRASCDLFELGVRRQPF